MRFLLLTVLCFPLFLGAAGETDGLLVVGPIKIEGNKSTKPYIILRAMNFSEGDTIWQRELETVLKTNQNNIYNTHLFNEVILRDSVSNGVIYLNIKVKERWYIFPIPHIGFEERTINEWWKDKDLDRLVLGLNLVWNNVRGRNESLWFSCQTGYSKKLELYYSIPYIIPKKRIGLCTDVLPTMRERDSLHDGLSAKCRGYRSLHRNCRTDTAALFRMPILHDRMPVSRTFIQLVGSAMDRRNETAAQP